MRCTAATSTSIMNVIMRSTERSTTEKSLRMNEGCFWRSRLSHCRHALVVKSFSLVREFLFRRISFQFNYKRVLHGNKRPITHHTTGYCCRLRRVSFSLCIGSCRRPPSQISSPSLSFSSRIAISNALERCTSTRKQSFHLRD